VRLLDEEARSRVIVAGGSLLQGYEFEPDVCRSAASVVVELSALREAETASDRGNSAPRRVFAEASAVHGLRFFAGQVAHVFGVEALRSGLWLRFEYPTVAAVKLVYSDYPGVLAGKKVVRFQSK
jgi:hypothetical protein